MTTQRILLLAGRFGLSGVPLAQLRLARVLAERGHTVKLVYGMLNEGIAPPVADGVDIEFLQHPRVSSMVLPLIRIMWTYRPDVIFSAGDHLNAMVLLAALLSRTKAKISCSSRVTPYDTYSRKIFSKGWILKQVMRLMMPRADALTCVSKDMVEQYRAIFPSSRHVCVYNIVDGDPSNARRAAPDDSDCGAGNGTRMIVAAGALEPWKGFKDLIDAMSVVVQSENAHLTILGEGSQRIALQQQIEGLGLEERVHLRGNVTDPLNYFANADTFVLSSYVEGLPNVLVEAMRCGCSPVATDCPTGPREVLQDGRYGYLVPMADSEALAAGIVQSLRSPISVDTLRHGVREFQADAVLKRHADLLGLGRL